MVDIEEDTSLIEFQENIGYRFKNKSLLKKALTHSSYANESMFEACEHNERLEFLGDSVLNLVVSEYIYKKFPDCPEGKLTKFRASMVCEFSLAYIARKINLAKYLLLGKGEEATGGRYRNSIKADAFEALIGAIYLDGGFESSKKFILNIIKREFSRADKIEHLFVDYKTRLQEEMQKMGKKKVEYKVLKETGPDHNKIFYMGLIVDNKIYGIGKGRNKKDAEQRAAKSALEKLGVI